MVNKWEPGQLYTFNNYGYVRTIFYELDWLKTVYVFRSEITFVLLERPRSENVPKGLPSRPSGNWGKILLSSGEIFWAKLERYECSVITRKWLRNHPDVR
jgi:hypothetical protein